MNNRALMDTCVRLEFVAGSVDEYGLDKPETYETAETLACLFRKPKPGEAMEQAEVAVNGGQLRLARGTTISARDRIRLTHLHGEALSPVQVYKIIGEPKQTYAGIVLILEMITDGS